MRASAVAIEGKTDTAARRRVLQGAGSRNCEEWARAGVAGGEIRGEADEKERSKCERRWVLSGKCWMRKVHSSNPVAALFNH